MNLALCRDTLLLISIFMLNHSFCCSKAHVQSFTAKPASVSKSAQKNTATTCDYCTDHNPASEFDLSYHLNTKHKDKILPEWLQCFNCSWSYSSKENLDIHRSFCKIKIDSTEDIFSSNIGIRCQFCPTVFRKTQLHIYYKHARDNHPKKVDYDWQKCESCLLAYPTELSLQNHQR